MVTKLSLESRHAETGCRLIIDDDGRVAYAFLLDAEDTIIGDVWLYNRVAPPAEIDFAKGPPFLNPYARALEQAPPSVPGDLSVTWELTDETLLVDISLRGHMLARLSPGAQPGWHLLAHEGPLAQPLNEEPNA